MALKLQPLSIGITGFLLGAAILSYGYFQHYSPNMAEKKNFDDTKEQLDAEAAKMPKAKKRVEDAIAKFKEYDNRWSDIVEVATPEKSLAAGGIDLSVNRWQLTVDARRFRNNLQAIVNRQAVVGGVKVVSGPQVPDFKQTASDIIETDFNFPGYSFPVLFYDLGEIQVEGTYDQIERNVEAWNRIPNLLAVTDGLVIEGTSPRLRGTYNLSIVGFIRGAKVAAPVPEVAGSGAGGGGGANAAPGASGGRGGRGAPGADF